MSRALNLDAFYPPSPQGVPALAETTGAYRLRVVIVLASLAVFLAVYLGLLGLSCWLVAVTFTGITGFFSFLAFLASLMVCLFLCKGIFKRGGLDTSSYVRLKESEQPRLFAFVRRLCEEENTPFPRAVYLAHDVNAAVFYPRSLATLFLPARKNLLVGLGLVNLLDLSEFKAVLAHEFGHFAQSSMKLGQYVYVANQTLADMVFGRDFWDEWLARWRNSDVRIGFPAWGVTILVWALRLLLGVLFRVINIANLSLSRQMEFNADLFAVRLTGSDPLISGLQKTERGALAYQKAWADLASLAQHHKFTDNAYYHQLESIRQLNEFLEDADDSPHVRSLRTPYVYGRKTHFQASDEHSSTMWESHPSNRDREVNAKKHYLPVEAVETSAWELFRFPDRLRSRLTSIAYQECLSIRVGTRPRVRASEMSAAMRQEREEMQQADHYHGLYEDRAVEPGDIAAHCREIDAGLADPDRLRAEALAWAGDNLAATMKRYADVCQEIDLLAQVASGEVRVDADTFELRGERHRVADAERVAVRIAKERDAMLAELSNADRATFRYSYWRSAGAPQKRQELLERYRFMVEVQAFVLMLNQEESQVGAVLDMLQANPELGQEQYQQARECFDDAHRRLQVALVQCDELELPKLSHLEKERTVRCFVLRGKLVPPMDEENSDPTWLERFLDQFQQVLGRLRKLHFKNLGVLLRLQEELAPELFGAAAPAPEPAAAVPPPPPVPAGRDSW